MGQVGRREAHHRTKLARPCPWVMCERHREHQPVDFCREPGGSPVTSTARSLTPGFELPVWITCSKHDSNTDARPVSQAASRAHLRASPRAELRVPAATARLKALVTQPTPTCRAVSVQQSHGQRRPWARGIQGKDGPRHPTGTCCSSDTARTHSEPCTESRRTCTRHEDNRCPVPGNSASNFDHRLAGNPPAVGARPYHSQSAERCSYGCPYWQNRVVRLSADCPFWG